MNNAYFSTSDFPLAVTLLSLGFILDSLNSGDAGRSEFRFSRETSLDETVQAFWRGELRLEPKTLFLNHKLLKSRLYSAS